MTSQIEISAPQFDDNDTGDPLLSVRLCGDGDWLSVVALGDQFKRFLGLYPAGAIREAISDGRVIGAFKGDELIGYVLFDLPRADIRLIHLCISASNRRLGVARKLVDEIQFRHLDRNGIRLKCRRDYDAHKIWPKLGFQAQSMPRGRGSDRAEMTAWWRDFDRADLFTNALDDDERIIAVLDTNVVMDSLLQRNSLTGQYLESPGLNDEVLFCVTRSIKNELSEIVDKQERQLVMSALSKFQTLTGALMVCDQLTRELIHSIPAVERVKDTSLANDARVVAESIVAGASVLLTNDDNAARFLRGVANRHGLEILHPSQLIVVIDDLKGIRRDAPYRLQNTAVVAQRASAGVDRELDHLVSAHLGESKSDFMKLLRSKAGSDVRTIHTTQSTLVDGLVASAVAGERVDVGLLRVRRSPLGPTLLKQLLFQLRHQALALGAARITVSDPNPGGGEFAQTVLTGEGARKIDGDWVIEVVDAQLSLAEVHRGTFGPWDFRPWSEGRATTPDELTRLERELWPLKILDAPLPCYVVPIQQSYASELLGYDAPLLARADTLGISRRHVYFKSPNYFPIGPGRILWYVSGPRGGAIVASSQLISTHRASPRTLHSRFRKYGVWGLSDIEKSAKKGKAVALRFGDTEVFNRHIKLSEAELISSRHGNSLGTIPTVRRIAGEAFHEIYSKGMRR